MSSVMKTNRQGAGDGREQVHSGCWIAPWCVGQQRSQHGEQRVTRRMRDTPQPRGGDQLGPIPSGQPWIERYEVDGQRDRGNPWGHACYQPITKETWPLRWNGNAVIPDAAQRKGP